MPPLKANVHYFQSPDFYGIGSTHLLIESHRFTDYVPTADICIITQTTGADGRPAFKHELTQIHYDGTDQALGDMGFKEPIEFMADQALAWAKNGLLSRILDQCRKLNITPSPDVIFNVADWPNAFRMMRLNGLSESALDEIRDFFYDDGLRDGLKDIRYKFKPLIFDKPKPKNGLPK